MSRIEDPPAEPADAGPPTWCLTPDEFAATRARAAAINARALKRGFTGRIEVAGIEREISEIDDAGLTRTTTVVDTTITGEAPCYGGWEFLAAVDTIETPDGHDFVLRTAPGIDDSGVDRSQLEPGRCQHCSTLRPNRRYTYLVRNTETQQAVQVGSTCIKDFTGWAGKPVFISVDELGAELREYVAGLGADRALYSPTTVVAAAWAISRRYGWGAASAAFSARSTRDQVSSYLYGTSKADRELRHDVAGEIADAEQMAQTIVPALLEGLQGNGDYVTNLKTCLRATHVDHRHLGIVVSAVAAYERMIGDRERKAAALQQKPPTRFAGTIGEKITITGTITRLRPIEGIYGYRPKPSMLIVVDAGETVAKTFTGASWAWDLEQGQTLTVTGTVKDHEDYQGSKQTVLTRPKASFLASEAPSTLDPTREADTK